MTLGDEAAVFVPREILNDDFPMPELLKILGELVERNDDLTGPLQGLVGNRYWSGTNAPRDYKKAVQHYQAAVSAGSLDAHYSLGLAYKAGKGVPKDRTEARRHFKIAAEAGHATAQMEMAVSHASNTSNDPEGVLWLKRAAAQGEVNAYLGLGNNYQHGKGVEPNYAEAQFWFEKALESGKLDDQTSRTVRLRLREISRGPRVFMTDKNGKRWYEERLKLAIVVCWLWSALGAVLLFVALRTGGNWLLEGVSLLLLLTGPGSLFLDVPKLMQIRRERNYRDLDRAEAGRGRHMTNAVAVQQPQGHSYDEGSI